MEVYSIATQTTTEKQNGKKSKESREEIYS